MKRMKREMMKKKLQWSSLPSSIKHAQNESLSQIKYHGQSKPNVLTIFEPSNDSSILSLSAHQSSSSQTTPLSWIEYYLSGYSAKVQQQVYHLMMEEKLVRYLEKKYPESHQVKNDHALHEYVHIIKQRYMRKAATINKVCYDEHLQTMQHALGTHTYISRVQGQKLKAKHEIRVASLFKHAPLDLLRMIVVHELAHCREKEHNKAFYQLCVHMLPEYHQVELDTRIFLLYGAVEKQKNNKS